MARQTLPSLLEDLVRCFLQLNERVEKIEKEIEKLKKSPDALIKEEWMDGQDVMFALNISRRTLCTLRTSGRLFPTKLNKKFYYKVSDIQQLLTDNYIRYHHLKKS
jgi:hypothetical protein